MENFINDTREVLEVTPKINNSLMQSLNVISSSGYLIHDGNVIGRSIWDLPLVLNYFESDDANRELLKVVSDHILVSEKRYPTLGKALINSVVSNSLEVKSKLKRLSIDQIVQEIKKNDFGEESNKIIDKIIELGNPSLSISINRQPIETPTLRFSSHPMVRLKLADGFILQGLAFKNCRFFVVEGALANPSELTKILNYSFENKEETIFIVCKSFNQEVLHTLQENYARNITNVVPLVYGFDLESINSISDICAITGSIPYTPIMGDVLIAADLDKMGKADVCQISVQQKNLTVKSSQNYTAHRQRLVRKIDNEANEDKRRILSKRLSLISSNSCMICLPSVDKYKKVEQDIMYFILLLNSLSKNRCVVCKTSDQEFYITDQAAKLLDQSIEKINQILSTEIVLKRSKKCRQKNL